MPARSPQGPIMLDASAAAAPPRNALFIVVLVVVIDLLGFGIVLPLLPVFAEGYVSVLLPGSPRAAGAVLGLLMASFSAMQFFFAPLWGRVSDRVGRRPILLLGLAASALFYFLFGYACGLPREEAALAVTLLFVGRVGAGVAGATIATAQAVVADCTPPEGRKLGMSLIGAAFGVGFAVGPLVGFAALTWFPDRHAAVGYAAAGLSSLAFALGVALLPETRNFAQAPPLPRRWLDLGAVRWALGSAAIGPVVLTFFLATLGFASFEVTLALLNKDVVGLSDPGNFLVFAYVGFTLALTQGVYRKVARQRGEPALMAFGIAAMGLGVLALGGVTLAAGYGRQTFGQLLAAELVSLALAVVGFGFLTPSAQALISRRTEPGRQGEVLGVNQSASALARILGPVLGMTLYYAHGTHLLPYAAGAGLLLLMLPLIPRIRRAEPPSPSG